MTAADLFRRIVTRLEETGIPYMLTGSFASAYHGRPRATQNIDFVIAPSPDQLRALIQALPPTEYYADQAAALEAHRQESQFNVIDLGTGWKIDFICRKSRPFSRTEFDRRIRANLEGLSLYIASAEDLLLAKLEWAKLGGSERQIEDVAGLRAAGGARRGAGLGLYPSMGGCPRDNHRMGGCETRSPTDREDLSWRAWEGACRVESAERVCTLAVMSYIEAEPSSRTPAGGPASSPRSGSRHT